MKAFVISLVLLSLALNVSAANWAVLVAGSNGFWNYRHQADVCHAYHTLLKKGIPASNIIVLSYNDVAKDSSNPFPNTLYNKPNTTTDFNAGCVIDYSLDDVTPKNFLAVLTGDAATVKGKGTGRVLKSTANDYVFINFADHGAPGLIAFPNEYLYATDLLPALQKMHDTNMYKQLVFYLEACESGSMFQNLPKNTNIYALSAASPDESSWAAYCPPDQDTINGQHIGSCLGDLFSVNWMEDTDAQDTSKENLQTQFEAIKKLTTQSQVMQWGDVSWTTESVGTFVGGVVTNEEESRLEWLKDLFSRIRNVFHRKEHRVPINTVNSRDAKLVYLQAKFERDPSVANRMALQQEKAIRKYYDMKFLNTATTFGVENTYHGINKVTGVANTDCYKRVIAQIEQSSGKLPDYALKYLKVVADICDRTNHITEGIVEDVSKIFNTL